QVRPASHSLEDPPCVRSARLRRTYFGRGLDARVFRSPPLGKLLRQRPPPTITPRHISTGSLFRRINRPHRLGSPLRGRPALPPCVADGRSATREITGCRCRTGWNRTERRR